MKTLTLEEFDETQKTKMAELHEITRSNLKKAGIEELLPVQ